MSERIGFMQGRLSPLVNNAIQAFPWHHWQEEFTLAKKNGFCVMEWTLDQDRLHENPLLIPEGQSKIRFLCQRHGLTVSSLTGDCFMQSPFWKNCDGNQGLILQKDFLDVIKACQSVGILIVVVPLVDHGRIDSAAEEDTLVGFLKEQEEFLINQGVRVAFESDFSPVELVRFIDRFGSDVFGINYDIGNSAALGFDPREEIRTYGDRIINVHIKDRRRGGGTVPLGMGHANFEAAFSELARVGYSGNYILQTARALDGQHENVLCRYRDMVSQWLARYAA